MKIPTIIHSPVGRLLIHTANEALIQLKFVDSDYDLVKPQDEFSKVVVSELEAYFGNPHHSFSIPYKFKGTPFQQSAWQALARIQAGNATTYGELAKRLESGPRAIGQACRTNPIAIVIPCHRVVAANHLGGFAGNIKGHYAEIKKWLLQHEGFIQS